MDNQYSDPVAEQLWLDDQEEAVKQYMKCEGIECQRDLEIEWCVAPIVAIWRIDNARANLPAWVICGDLPTDFIIQPGIATAREATKAFCARWFEVANYLLQGKQHPTIVIGNPAKPDELPELGELLRRRAETLLSWTENDEKWAAGC